MNSEQFESDKVEIWSKSLDQARWLISLKIPDFPYNPEDDEVLAEKIFKTEISRLREGKPSLFERKGVIPDATILEEPKEDFWNA